MRILHLSRFAVTGPGPAAGPKTQVAWVEDSGNYRTRVFEGHLLTLEEAEEAIGRLPPR